MADDVYKVILKGYAAGKGEYYIEEDFAKLFKISREKAKELFAQVPVTLKQNISEAEAQRYQDALKHIGAKCEIENTRFDLGGLTLED